MDREKAEVYRIIADMIAKMFLVVVSAGVFVAGAVVLFLYPNIYLAAFDAVCGYSIGKVITHYFPTRSAAGKKLLKK